MRTRMFIKERSASMQTSGTILHFHSFSKSLFHAELLSFIWWVQDASVRSAAITGLKNLYNYPRNVHGMRDFTVRLIIHFLL